MTSQLSYLIAFVLVATTLIVGVGLVLAAARVTRGPVADAQLIGDQQVGRWGKVVVAIPCVGVGQVRVAGQSVTTALPACALDKQAIACGETVVVVELQRGTLQVVPLYDAPTVFASVGPTELA